MDELPEPSVSCLAHSQVTLYLLMPFPLSVAQYWRCTQQKPYDEVAQCVIDNSQKVNWVSQPIIYEGAKSCPTAYYWIGIQVATVLGALLMRVLSVMAIPLVKKLISKKKKSPVLEGEEMTGPIQPWNIGPDKPRPRVEAGAVMIPRSGVKKEKNIWAREEVFILPTSQLVASLAGEVIANILAVIVIRSSGVGAFFDERNVIWDLFVLFAIRPRLQRPPGLPPRLVPGGPGRHRNRRPPRHRRRHAVHRLLLPRRLAG